MPLARISGRTLIFVGLWLFVEKWCEAFGACSGDVTAVGYLGPSVALGGVLLTLGVPDMKPSVPAMFGAAFWNCLTGYLPSVLVVGVLSFLYLRLQPDPTGELAGMMFIGAFYLAVFVLPALAGYGILTARDDEDGIVGKIRPPMTPSTAREEDEGGEKADPEPEKEQ